MARISLKAYNREVESLIDSGQIDQAIAHCRHILKFYPKHVDTYRLLGKAYLESRRYGDAGDILQRVLSSVPEDFVSHVGMSIIREDEGNLDEAIWHMERAFEVQPANNAIQEELRRLYGRRDGLEPPKVRLTRGALARMYAKGDLHQQAISELRAALAEDPERLELQALLANVYARAGHRAEAAETCNTLLRKLPYCLEANRVMTEVLASSERVSETHPYLSRVQALDPYAAHLSPTTNTIQRVPEQMVSLEKLDWKPGQPVGGAPSQPDWAASLGVAIDENRAEKEKLPEWLTSADEVFSSIDKEDEDSQERSILEVSPDSEFPWEDTSQTDLTDWLPEAEGEAAQPVSEDEVPEWMKEAGWSQPGEDGDSGKKESETLQALDELDLGVTESDDLAEAEIPDWLRAMAPSGNEEKLEQGITEEEFPWLQPESGDQLPGWLNEPEAETEANLAGKVDIWSETEDPFTTEEDETESADLEWLSGDMPTTQEEEPSTDWLPDKEELAEVTSAPAEEAQVDSRVPAEIASVEENEEEMPAWLKEALSEDEVNMASDEGLAEQRDAQVASEELPEWLRSLDKETPSEEETPIEWILESDQPEEISSQAVEQYDEDILEEDIAEPAESIPDWLREMHAAEDEILIERETSEPESKADEAELELELETPQSQEQVEPEAKEQGFDLEDEDAAFAWLESLAVKQGADEALLLTPEEREEKSSDWIRDEQPVVDEQLEKEAELAEEEIPGYEAPQVEEASIAPSDTQAPEWEPQFPEQIEVVSEAESEPTTDETTPDWLPEAVIFEEVSEESDELHEAEPDESMPGEETTFDLEDEDAAFAWLESLAVKQGADEALLLTPEERQEAADDWEVSQQVEETEIEPQAAVEFEAGQTPIETDIEETDDESELKGEHLMAASEEPAAPESISETAEAFTPPEGEPLEQVAGEEQLSFSEEDTKPVRVTRSEVPAAEAGTTPVEIPNEQASSAQELEESATKETESEQEAVTSPEEMSHTPAFKLDEEQKEVDADFAWLESLAVKQGADEALLLSPEERQEERPEWLPEVSGKAESPEGESTVEPLEPVVEQGELSAQETPEEVVEPLETDYDASAPEMGETEQPKPEETTPEMPAWLRELVADEEFSSTESVEDETVIPPFAEEPPGAEAIPELPGWLAEVEKGETREETWTPPEAPIRKLNLNEASLSELEKLPDIGFILAQSIVAYRETFGPYSDIDDLRSVSGIGPSTIDELRKYVYIEAPQEPEPLLEEEKDAPEAIKQARGLLNNNKVNEAIETYSSLINSQQFLKQVIHDLNAAAGHYPQEISIWQALGDAYLRSDKIQQALDAYTKAEELLR